MKEKWISRAIELKRAKKSSEALQILNEILAKLPLDPDVNYHIACIMDSMGQESQALPFYHRALDNGLIEGREIAYLGLGSTYRCLGEYQKSLEVFEKGLKEFPRFRPLYVFRSLTLFNLSKHQDAVAELLTQLIETTSDPEIQNYERALRFYLPQLTRVWK